MKTVLLVIDWIFENEYLGRIYIDGKFFGYSLEDPVRKLKFRNVSGIPFGEYTIQTTWSPKFNRNLPLIYNTPNLTVKSPYGDEWSGIRVHGGNTHRNSAGCVLTADNRHINQELKGKLNDDGSKIMNWISGNNIDLFVEMLGPGKHKFVKALEVNKEPLATINFKVTEPLTRHYLIGEIQRKLNSIGISVGTVDNFYGNMTKRAVAKYQELNGLKVTGVLDDTTYYSILNK